MRTERRAGVALVLATFAMTASAAVPEEILKKGTLRVAVYHDFAPFSDDDKGIDVDLGRALAEKLGVKPDFWSFPDAEKVDDDLRNVVWKGHFLWKLPLADVMMHVPCDKYLQGKNEQVKIFGPYYAERLVVARNRNRIPTLVTLEVFNHEKIGVQAETVEDNYLWNAFGGALRMNVVHFPTALDAAKALKKNEIAAVMGRQTALEAVLGDDAKSFGIAPVSTPGLSITGWDIGMAVKADRPELVAALDQAMSELLKEGKVQAIFAKRGLTYLPPRESQASAGSGSSSVK